MLPASAVFTCHIAKIKQIRIISIYNSTLVERSTPDGLVSGIRVDRVIKFRLQVLREDISGLLLYPQRILTTHTVRHPFEAGCGCRPRKTARAGALRWNIHKGECKSSKLCYLVECSSVQCDRRRRWHRCRTCIQRSAQPAEVFVDIGTWGIRTYHLTIRFDDSRTPAIRERIFNRVRFEDEARIVRQVHAIHETEDCRAWSPAASSIRRRQRSTSGAVEVLRQDEVISCLERCPI